LKQKISRSTFFKQDHPEIGGIMKILKKSAAMLFFAVLVSPGIGWGFNNCQFKDTINIYDADISGSRTFYDDTLYILSELVFVEDGEILTIEPGTVIWSEPGQAEEASALIVARGGKIYAQGTEDNPIIFTMQGDNVCDPFDIPFGTRGQWGGVIILGRDSLNTSAQVGHIEGVALAETRADYGGGATPDVHDNSGIFTYVSIRHGGSIIGEANEINGLTMGCVGDGTVIHHVEVINNLDDGFEWFGSTVNTKYLISAFNGDDGFDWDEGFRGKGQFWLTIQDSLSGSGADACGEHDGGTVPEDLRPFATPTIYNATYLGSGKIGADPGINSRLFAIRDNSGGFYYNSIFGDGNGRALNIENVAPTTDLALEDSERRLRVGDLAFEYDIFWDLKSYTGTLASIVPETWAQDYFNGVAPYNVTDGTTNDMETKNPLLVSISRTDNSSDLDPRLRPASPALSDPIKPIPVDPFFTQVTYKGAFSDSTDNVNFWLRKWTYLYQRGFTPFLCGDASSDMQVNILDIVHLINYKYKAGPPPWPMKAGDADGNGQINILDIVNLINFKYKAGPAPVCS